MKQSCFSSFKEKTPPSFNDFTLIPSISRSASTTNRYAKLKSEFLGNSPKIRINEHVSFNRSKLAAGIFEVIDGKASSQEIIEKVHQLFGPELDIKVVENHYKSIIELLIKVSVLYLRKPGTKPFQTIPQLLSRMYEIYGEKACKEARKAYLAKTQNLL